MIDELNKKAPKEVKALKHAKFPLNINLFLNVVALVV